MRPERSNFTPERANNRRGWADLRPERVEFRSERAYFRSKRPDEGGGMKRRMNEQTNGQTNKSHPVFYRFQSPSGPLPKKAEMETVKEMEQAEEAID